MRCTAYLGRCGGGPGDCWPTWLPPHRARYVEPLLLKLMMLNTIREKRREMRPFSTWEMSKTSCESCHLFYPPGVYARFTALRMSLKEGSMAAQGMDVHHGEASPSSSPHGNSFVKSIDKKARSYLKTIERSFSFSMSESKGEDPSTMTIEFLRARLQAQRAEYKAEKQRSQQLAKKVLELEQRLNFEVEQRRKAEYNNMQLISPNYRSGPPSRLKDTNPCSEREGLTLINSKFKDNSSGEDDHSDWCSEISGSEGHPDGDAVFLISPSSLRRHWESVRHERQQRADQHAIKEATPAASILDKECSTSNDKELRDMCETTSCDEHVLSMKGLKGIADRESSKLQAVTTDVKQKSTFEAWNISYPQSSRASNTFDIPDLEHEKPSEAGYIVHYDNPRRQESTVCNADKGFGSDSSQHHMHATKAMTHHPNNYLARPIDSCQNYQPKNPSSPLDKMVSANLPPQRGVYVQDFHASLEANGKVHEFGALKRSNLPQLSKSMSAGHDRILEYIIAHSNSITEIQEERPSLRQLPDQESKSEYVKGILAPECMNDFESMSALRQSSEKLQVQKTNATFNNCRSSAVQTRSGRKLHGRRMSLDGGLDNLQKVGKEIGRALEDGEAAK